VQVLGCRSPICSVETVAEKVKPSALRNPRRSGHPEDQNRSKAGAPGNWGSITNTSIEGSKKSPATGVQGDWTGTAFEPIFDMFGDEELAGMFFGNVWKKAIIDRPEQWIGIRFDPTFPQKGITLMGKTYFLAR
jgi:hypothetical protein